MSQRGAVKRNLEQVSFAAARLTAAALGFCAAALAMIGSGAAVLGFLCLSLLSLGIWMLWPMALRFGTAALLVVAVIVPLGIVNPFYVSDAVSAHQVDSGFMTRTIAVGFGASLFCVVLAYLVSQARVARERQGRDRR